MHVTCDLPRITYCPHDKFIGILGPAFSYKQPDYQDLLQSIPGVTGILMIILMAFTFTLATHSFRRNVIKLPWPFHHLAGFNAFWYTHHLLVIVFALFIIHGYFLFLTREWYNKTVNQLRLLLNSTYEVQNPILISVSKNSQQKISESTAFRACQLTLSYG